MDALIEAVLVPGGALVLLIVMMTVGAMMLVWGTMDE